MTARTRGGKEWQSDEVAMMQMGGGAASREDPSWKPLSQVVRADLEHFLRR